MFVLEYKQSVLVGDEEPSRYVKHVRGAICTRTEADRRVPVGVFELFLFDVELAVNERDSVFDAFDYSSQTVDLYDLYQPSGYEFKAPVMKALPGGHRWAPNMLYLALLQILPKYRGSDVGLEIIKCMIQHFGSGSGIVVMKPFPLQFEGQDPPTEPDAAFVKYRLGEFDQDQGRAMRKLQAYYRRLGFRKVRGTPYMVCDPYMPIRIAAKAERRLAKASAPSDRRWDLTPSKS